MCLSRPANHVNVALVYTAALLTIKPIFCMMSEKQSVQFRKLKRNINSIHSPSLQWSKVTESKEGQKSSQCSSC